MAKPIPSDELWAVLEPLLPAEPPKPRGGRPRLPNRTVLPVETAVAVGKSIGFSEEEINEMQHL